MGISRKLLVLLLLVLLGGCLPHGQSFPGPDFDLGQGGSATPRLNCFLVLKDEKGPSIRLEVASLEVLANDFWQPLSKGPLTIDSTAIGAGQFYLGGVAVPPGRYQRLRMTVTGGKVQAADGKFAAIGTEPFVVEMSLPEEMILQAEDSRTLLLTWDVENSLQPDNSVQPVLTAAPSVKQLLRDLVFVACPDIDTVFVIRADKNWVVDSFGLKGRPTYMAVDPDSSRQRLYVLAARDKMVKVLDLSSYRVVDYYQIHLNDMPTFMTISPDGTAAFLLDEQSGYLSRMDLTTGRISSRILLGFRPKYAVYLADQGMLAVSLSLSQRVLLLDPVNLGTQGVISTGSLPQGLAVADGQLYIAESGGNAVSIVDLNSRSTQNRLSVGLGPLRLLGANDQVYVSNFADGTISVLAPGQLGVVQEIFGLGRPKEMAFDQFYFRLYVTNEEEGALAVVNANTNLLIGHVSLGAKPLGLAVVQ